jgi:hypothetical protein
MLVYEKTHGLGCVAPSALAAYAWVMSDAANKKVAPATLVVCTRTRGTVLGKFSTSELLVGAMLGDFRIAPDRVSLAFVLTSTLPLLTRILAFPHLMFWSGLEKSRVSPAASRHWPCQPSEVRPEPDVGQNRERPRASAAAQTSPQAGALPAPRFGCGFGLCRRNLEPNFGRVRHPAGPPRATDHENHGRSHSFGAVRATNQCCQKCLRRCRRAG